MKNVTYCKTPLGEMAIVEENGKIVEACFRKIKDAEILTTPVLKEAKAQLEEYFTLKRNKFNLPLNPKGTTFQKKVWGELLKIPYGKTTTYGEIASKIGNKNASRAVGGANNKNPIPIFIPCHRVIGKSGNLTGYALGLDIKEKLLKLEQKV
jgi:methylated-DNA-[protein]-cysteine S-methyltransferase